MQRILTQELKMHPHRPHLFQRLSDDDKEQRVVFYENAFFLLDNDEIFLSNLLFTDQASFHISGDVNKIVTTAGSGRRQILMIWIGCSTVAGWDEVNQFRDQHTRIARPYSM